MGLAKGVRYVAGGTLLMVSQSLVFGVATLPALLFWQWAREMAERFHLFAPYGALVIIATSLVPSYYIFATFLMFLSAGWNRVARWRTTAGEYPIHDANWTVVRWAAYNASIQLVRVFAGEVMRTTPLWTLYLKANGARIGRGVYVNSARLFDHNLLVLGDKAVVGGDAKLVAHLVERGSVKATSVVLGKNAVVGINTVISPGVEIGEGSAVGAMSFVPKHVKIPPYEVWGGVPARLIKRYDEKEFRKTGIPATA